MGIVSTVEVVSCGEKEVESGSGARNAKLPRLPSSVRFL